MIHKKIYHPPKIPLTKGRRIVIGDIHGCFHSLIGLLEQIDLRQEDQLFLLGDYINRGNSSAEVLDLLLEIQQTHTHFYPLRGNHEEKFLHAYKNEMDFFEKFLHEYGSVDLLNESLYDYLEFCHNLNYAFFTKEYFLSHCGITDGAQTPQSDIRSMFSTVDIQITEPIIGKYKLIYGHFATRISVMIDLIEQKSDAISLDGGCVYSNEEGLGYLCALDLDNNELYVQKNIERASL